MFSRVKTLLFASGGGSNAAVLLEAMQTGWIAGDPIGVVVDRECGAIDVANRFNVAVHRFLPKQFTSRDEWNQALTDYVIASGAEFILLCGYLKLIPEALCRLLPDRIINIHPGPLPRYGGNGMWGHHVHEAVLAAHEQWSGPTIHYVNEEYDKGAVIAHVPVPVLTDDSVESLASRVLAAEHRLYPLTIAQLFYSYLQSK